MHTFVINGAFAVALAMLACSAFALIALSSPPVFTWRAKQSGRFLRQPLLLLLLWLALVDVAQEGFFDALLNLLLFGWMWWQPKTKPAPLRSELAAEALFLGVAGMAGVLVYYNLVQRVLGPVGVFLLKPLVLVPVSFAFLLYLVWRSFRNASDGSASSTTARHSHS